ncbi:Maltodextrin phosphorylase [uncultured archaeon]|nr:Maltodextrin phosphorylase [uncultured archaeon]
MNVNSEEWVENPTRIAYFSMEIALKSEIPTYSGGLGILAGDTLRAFADLNIPATAFTLLDEQGYFKQTIDEDGNQTENPDPWDPRKYCKKLDVKISLKLYDRTVNITAWQYDITSEKGFTIPVILLDSNLPENNEYDKRLTSQLYGGDSEYRLCQEAILGIGGIKVLRALHLQPTIYHMNEGHAALLAMELLEIYQKIRDDDTFEDELEHVKRKCVFTSHTPVAAGHDRFSYDLVKKVLGTGKHLELLERLGGKDELNMTLLGLNLSKYVNGVAKKHGEVSREMFPGYEIHAITNGVHSKTWTSDSFQNLFNEYISTWKGDPFMLRTALTLPNDKVWEAHVQAKKDLIDYVNLMSKTKFEYDTFTIGFARRMTQYKQPTLLFKDLERLKKISEKTRIQVILSGKAHPHDFAGKDFIRELVEDTKKLTGSVNCIFISGYSMDIAKKITSGVDLWLNTPLKPQEASGTSGMKAAHNGVPNFSVLDGWWLEGHAEGITGWSIGDKTNDNDEQKDLNELYDKLENKIIPMYYNDKNSWINIMKNGIAYNAAYFNTHRMAQQYALNAYLL